MQDWTLLGPGLALLLRNVLVQEPQVHLPRRSRLGHSELAHYEGVVWGPWGVEAGFAWGAVRT